MERAGISWAGPLVILAGILTLTGVTYPEPMTVPSPVFDYPQDGQTLNYPSAHLFRVHPVIGA